MKKRKLFALLAMLVMACLAFAGCNNSSSDDEDPSVAMVTVTYDANGHGTAPEAATVAVGSKLTKPADPSADGWAFVGWYKDAECTRAWDFEDGYVTVAITLYAKWYDPLAFSVSATSKVHFATGNLYYDGGTSTFNFEAKQSDYRNYNGMTDDSAVIDGIAGTTPSGTVGSFYWSKTDSVAYAESYSDSGTSEDDIFFTNEKETTAKADFTVNGETGKWRTLSSDEWAYLLDSRTSGNRFAKAKVNDVCGLLIFPDGYSGTTSGDGIAKLNSTLANFPAASIESATWTAMESAGCVFLPAAGYRYNSSVRGAGIGGAYWSSSPYDSTDAYFISFFSGDIYTSYAKPRNYGMSVRLVCDAN